MLRPVGDHSVARTQEVRVDKGTMNVKEVARYLGLSVSTVYKRVRDGSFPIRPLRLPTRVYLFSRESVERYVNVNTWSKQC